MKKTDDQPGDAPELRKRAEEDLHLFKDLVEHSSDAIGMSTPDGRHYYQNESFDRLFGDIGDYPLDTLYVDRALGKHMFDTIMGGGSWQGEVKMFKKDGEILDISLRAYAIQDQDNRVIGLVGLHTDITERKRAEEAIEESEARFSMAFEVNVTPMAISTLKEGRFIDVNPAFLARLGFSRDEVIGNTSKTLRLFQNPNERDAVVRMVEETGKAQGVDVQMRAKDGTIRDGLFSACPMMIGSEPCLLTIMLDITERKRAEEEREKAAALLQAAILQSPSGILIADAPDVTIQWANPAALGIRGGSPDLLTGIDVTQHSVNWLTFHTDGTPYPSEELPLSRAVLRGESTYGEEVIIRNETGEDHWVAVNASPVRNSHGAITAGIVIFHDITERKRAEAMREKLEAQNRQLQKSESLGRMAGAIAHHFNNKLMGVIGNLEVALSDLPRGTGLFNNLSTAMQAACLASEVSRQMLTYLGQTMGKQEPLDLAEACLRNLPIFEVVMPKNVVLRADLPSPGPVVNANTNQIQQILTNFVTNAWEAGDGAGGVIHLSVKEVLASDISEVHRFPIDSRTLHNAYACVEVGDTGHGIIQKDIEKLFDPFFSRKFVGRGMGLAVVLGIVRAHAGFVTVESEQGIGSIFRVYFPLAAEGIPEKPVFARAAQVPEIQGWGTVLLVDDEEMLRKLGATMLTRQGFTVLIAQDGIEAIEVFRKHVGEIRFVLCDLTMPRMDGWATLTALRQIVPGIPVILASGYNEEEVMEGDHPELPQAFLGKPYRREQLLEAIRKALEIENVL